MGYRNPSQNQPRWTEYPVPMKYWRGHKGSRLKSKLLKQNFYVFGFQFRKTTKELAQTHKNVEFSLVSLFSFHIFILKEKHN